jgi:2-oxoisovalerate dehydrogenase E1 component
MESAIEYVRSGEGPAMVHADCVRMGAHSNSDRQELYRSKEEIANGTLRDPVRRFREAILADALVDEAALAALEAVNEQVILEAAAHAEASPTPDPATALNFIVPESAPAGESSIEFFENGAKGEGDPVPFIQAINLTLKEEFRRNANTFLWGQDVASKDKGGVFNVTKGMQQEFGHGRVFNAPIAEDFIVGTANGFCRFRNDIWVVVEGAEFADYFWPAMEQLIECSHEYYRTNGQFVPNLVIRLASGGYIGGGLYHSQNLEGTFTTLPGLRVVCPAFADDAAGLLRYAMRTRGVTLYLEPKFLYNYNGARAARPSKDVCIPFGKARRRRQGDDLTIVTYGNTVHWSLRAADTLSKEHGVECDVIDLRSLAPWDADAVLESVRRTNRALVVHEDKRTGGFGGEIASTIAERAFDRLDAPVGRVGSKDAPVPFAKPLEEMILPNPDWIVAAALDTAKY